MLPRPFGPARAAAPVVVNVTRGGRIESRHAVDVAVVDTDGTAAVQRGTVDEPVFPRSAIKALLALPLVESGGADRLGLDRRALALACASHDGSADAVAVATGMLERAGHRPDALRCGAHAPFNRDAARVLARDGHEPTALHNNCSGKHAGLVCLSCALGLDPAGYDDPGHGAMREAVEALAAVTATPCDDRNRAIDGCSIPTHAIPLERLAAGMARFGTGHRLPPARAAAAARLRDAVAHHPVLVAGVGRFDTVLNDALGRAAFVKGGAEGVWCAALPERGLGIALKARDGAGRAAEAAMVGLLGALLEREIPWAGATLRNWNGVTVGAVSLAT